MKILSRYFVVLLALLIITDCAPKEREKIQTVFYPMPPQYPKLQYLTYITDEGDIGKKRDTFKEFLLGRKEIFREIARAYDIAATKGKIYVSDRTYKKILILDLENKRFDYIHDEKAGQLHQPAGIWITPDGKKYVADFGRKQIVVFGPDDQYVRTYGKEGQFGKPLDVVVYEDRMYVCDFDKNHIAVVDLESGETIHTIGKAGVKEGEFLRPTHLTIDQYGNLYVTDAFNFRIQEFDPLGQYVKHFGYHGDTLGAFSRPKGIAVDREGHLYAVDAAFENVQIFDEESTLLLLFFGGFGGAPGNMYLPSGIYIDYDNVKYFQKYVDKDFRVKYLVYVGNMLGKRKINVYGFGEWIGEPLPGLPPQRIKLD